MRTKKFPPEVKKKIKAYVYRLIDPRNGETFYVGKGKGNRVFQHVSASLKYSKDQDAVSEKIHTIREIKAAGLEIIHVIHRHGMDDKTALEVEAALIDAYPSATNIIGGKGLDYGVMNTTEIINKYKAEEVDFDHDKIIMITINKTFPERSVYEATRVAWKVNEEKASRANYVLSVQYGIVVGVFSEIKWKRATKQNFPILKSDIPDRFGFEGQEADDPIKKRYLNKRLPDRFRLQGAANPIKYNY